MSFVSLVGIVINNNSNSQTVVQMTDPMVIKLQSGLLRCLAPFPDARRAVVKMLTDLEATADRPVVSACEKINGHSLPAPLEIEAVANG
jgi:hypothetical protein